MFVLDASKSADQLREGVWGDRGFPIDPVWIAKQLGIDVVETDLPEEVSGALIKDKEKDAVIVLSKSDSKSRKRFTCAHELGHYANRVQNNRDEYQFVDLRGKAAASGTDPEEIFANKFAACLLMPAEEVQKLVKQKYPAFLMAQYFGVSDDAMSYRLNNLGLKC